jgi:hypothetical protein
MKTVMFYSLVLIQLIAVDLFSQNKRGAFDPDSTYTTFKVTIKPLFKTIDLSKNSIIIDGEAECYKFIDDWSIEEINENNLIMKYTMHEGSGRYWTIGIGKKSSVSDTLISGVYFNTTTIGYRTMQKFIDGALPWVKDFNGDGKNEIIIWSSFMAFGTETNSDYGLIAWVYELSDKNKFKINVSMTIQIWDKIIESYKMTRTQRSEHIIQLIENEKRKICKY